MTQEICFRVRHHPEHKEKVPFFPVVLYPYHIFMKKSTDNIARFLFLINGVDYG